MLPWLERLLAWDEQHDGTPVGFSVKRWTRWAPLLRDHELLEALADGEWVHEDVLRARLRWSRLRFFTATLRLSAQGWLRARPVGASVLSKSEFRLRPDAWTNGKDHDDGR